MGYKAKRERKKNEQQDRALQQLNEVMVALMKQQHQQQQQMQNLVFISEAAFQSNCICTVRLSSLIEHFHILLYQ